MTCSECLRRFARWRPHFQFTSNQTICASEMTVADYERLRVVVRVCPGRPQ